MKKIDLYVGMAPKVSGSGKIQYCLWLNNQGELYVQFEKNQASGTFSDHLIQRNSKGSNSKGS